MQTAHLAHRGSRGWLVGYPEGPRQCQMTPFGSSAGEGGP